MRVHLLAAGDAAVAVADRLTTELRARGDVTRTDVVAGGRGTDPAHWPHPDLRIVIAWRESAALLEAVDRSSAETGTPFAQAVFTHPRLRVGPTVVPGGSGGPADTVGGCQQCFEKRQRQHDAGIDKARALWERYAADETAGPAGFLPHHVSLAAALLGLVADAAREGRIADERNIVRTAHLLSGTVQRTELIPVHGCRRCGVPRPDSSWIDLAAEFGRASTTAVSAAVTTATVTVTERSTARV